MKLPIVILLSLLICFEAEAQKGKKICIAFYNQENLFDTIDTPNKFDEEFLPNGTYRWTSEKYNNKVENMGKVIAAMNEGKGPDFLGMCEVENDIAISGLTQTLARKKIEYGLIWFDSQDERGIDNALLYKKNLVKKASGHLYKIDTAGLGGDNTRGILMCDFILQNNARIVMFVNHWPSRREGEKESEYKRIFVAKRLRQICDSLQQKDPSVAIISMGDYNDYPDNVSIKEVMQGKASIDETGNADYFNPMNALLKKGEGSYKHRGEWNFLDQFLMNRNLLKDGTKINYVNESAAVFKEEWMLETEDKYKGNPKRTFGGKKYLNGYSDHLPVYLYLILK
ncbi:MAG: endonuclease/exonuclease/phosphatase family protein [bacterium]|nr:endonuclease/exonuclease/phosphatase family protein [bacterium]